MSDLRSKCTAHGRTCKILAVSTPTACISRSLLNPCNYPCVDCSGKLLSLILRNAEPSTPQVPDEMNKMQSDCISDCTLPNAATVQHQNQKLVVAHILPSSTSATRSSATTVKDPVQKSNSRRRWNNTNEKSSSKL